MKKLTNNNERLRQACGKWKELCLQEYYAQIRVVKYAEELESILKSETIALPTYVSRPDGFGISAVKDSEVPTNVPSAKEDKYEGDEEDQSTQPETGDNSQDNVGPPA
ncbi:MAG: hypothetical protein Q9224_007317 [Gallowayella concinna]